MMLLIIMKLPLLPEYIREKTCYMKERKAILFGLLVERCSECRSSGARTVMLFMEVCVDVMRLTSPQLCQQNGVLFLCEKIALRKI